MLWDSGQATAETDRETRTELDDIDESSEIDLEDNADADLENQSTQFDVDNEDITGVDPHDDEDVVESLEDDQDFEDGDVNGQTIDEDREDSDDHVLQEDSRGGSPRLQPPSTMDQESTPAVSGRPQRTRAPPSRLIPSFEGKSYEETGRAMVGIMKDLDGKTVDESIELMRGELKRVCPEVLGIVMAQMSMKAATVKFGELRTTNACEAEVKQIHMRDTFVPKHWKDLTPDQKSQVLEAFMFVEEKKNGQDKARLVVNGKMQRGHITKDEASSPTAHSESITLTGVIDAKEKRDVATVDIPNAFVQTVVADVDKDYRVLVRLRGRIVEILCKIAPEVYLPYVTVNKRGEKILIVQCLNALYGTMVASLLYYKKFVKSLRRNGFKLNPYDPCVANKIVNSKVLTICFHVDDCKISHVSEKVVDNTIEWLQKEYEVIFEDGTGAMKVHRGKVHVYLGMNLDFTTPGEMHVTMPKHIEDVLKTYDEALGTIEEQLPKVDKGFVEIKKRACSKAQMTPAPTDIFVVNEECKKLPRKQRELFHCIVAKCVYIWKRCHPDWGVAMSFLTKRVKAPDLDDWRKLVHLMDYVRADGDRPLILSADDSGNLTWYVDAAFAVHANGRSHTGGGLHMKKGFAISICSGQKLTTRSSTEAETVGVDDCMSLILWARLFLKAQSIKVRCNIILQDNQSSILLEKNGKASSGKRMRHINIRYFFITDCVKKGQCEVEWIRREEMVADYLTKGLQGSEFRRFRDFMMGSVV